MRPAFGGTAELLQLDLAGHRLGVVLERSGPRSAPLLLASAGVLPAGTGSDDPRFSLAAITT